MLGFVVSQQAFASGYEKSIMWGGRSAGFAGIATPYTSGADALYFNPAGIVADKTGQEVSFNISPVSSQFKGPINNQNDEATSATNLSTPFGLIYGNTVNEQWGFAVGGYVSGGSKVSYEDITFTGVPAGMDVKTDVQFLELALGAAYKVNDKLKLGASLRNTYSSGEFGFVQRLGNQGALGYSVLNAKLTGLKDTKPGFGLGAQYQLDEKTRLGLRYRSEVKIEASGTLEGNLHTAGPGASGSTIPVTPASGTAETTFPQALTLGAQHQLNEMWTLLAEYGWTNYSKVDVITLKGVIATTTTGTIANGSAVQQYWQDQHNYRLAAQYGTDVDWPVRFGYGYTSQVTNEAYARAAFTPPAVAHTLTVGTGRELSIGEKPLRFDSGLEYTFASGDGNPNGSTSASAGGGGDFRKGTFATSSYALHLGLAYMF